VNNVTEMKQQASALRKQQKYEEAVALYLSLIHISEPTRPY